MLNAIKKQSAFTLLEVLVVVGIMVIIFSASTSLLGISKSRDALESKAREVVSLIAGARDYASSGYLGDSWGIKVLDDSQDCDEDVYNNSSNWWNNSYSYRKKLTVTAGATAITTSNTITYNTDIASLVSAGKMQADHDDLRIVYWNGTTNTEIASDYLASGLGTVDGGSAVNSDVRFKAQAAIGAGNSDSGYYLYYGNSAASAPAYNLSNVYEYYNPFDSSGTWDLTDGGGSYTISGGRLNKTTTQATDRLAADEGVAFTTSGKNWFFEVTFQRTATTNTVSGAMVQSVVPVTAGWWFTTFGSTANDIERWRSGGKQADGTGTATISTSVDYRMTMKYTDGDCTTGTNFKAWIDGGLRHNSNNSNSGNCPTTLSPGVHTWNSQASWDNYKVWQGLGETVSAASEESFINTGDCVVMFKGTTYASRTSGYDKKVYLNNGVYIGPSATNEFYFEYNSAWLSTSTGNLAEQGILLNSNSGLHKTVTTTPFGVTYFGD